MPFSQSRADFACNFFERLLHYTEDEWYGKPFKLAPWQEEALNGIFGPVDDSGNNLIELAYCEVSKKTGKSVWCAGLILLYFILDENPGTQIYGAASSLRQAHIIYRIATKMIEQSPYLQRELKIFRSTYRILKRSDPTSFYSAIAADGDMTDGVNPSFVVCDELHRWHTRKQMDNFDVLSMGGIARRKTLTVAITTAGIVSESPLAWRLHEKTLRIKQGIASDPTFYGVIYGADKSDDWTSEQTWIKANPSLRENGGFLDISRIRKRYEACLSEPDGASAFKRYYLNIWDQKQDRAIDLAKWDACTSSYLSTPLLPKPPEDIVRPLHHDTLSRFIDRICWLGVDLSMSTDMSALSFVFPTPDNGYELLPFFYFPAAKLRSKELKTGVPLQRWAAEGWLEAHDGEAIDYAQVKERIRWGSRMFQLKEVCFDPWNSREISKQLIDDGLTCIEVPQSYRGLSEPIKHCLKLIETAKFYHGNHPILRWHASCLDLKSDGNDNFLPVKPNRKSQAQLIDGMTATFNAVHRAITGHKPSAYVGVKETVI
jgi:phage terminase large subunit-like protein